MNLLEDLDEIFDEDTEVSLDEEEQDDNKPSSIQKVDPKNDWINVYVLKESYNFIMDALSKKSNFKAKGREAACKLYFFILFCNTDGYTDISHDVMRDQISVSEHTLGAIICWLKDNNLLKENKANASKSYLKNGVRTPYDYIATKLAVTQTCTTESSIRRNCERLRFMTAKKALTIQENHADSHADHKEKRNPYRLVNINQGVVNSFLVEENLLPSMVLDPEVSRKIDDDIDFDLVKTINNPYPQPKLTPAVYDAPFLKNVEPVNNVVWDSNSKKWYKNRNNVSICGDRLYNAFTNTKRKFRKKLGLEGFKFSETSDMHNCYYVLISFFLIDNPVIQQEDFEIYDKIVTDGIFYEDVLEYKIKYYEEHWKDPDCFILRSQLNRDSVKKDLQAFRNSTPSERKKTHWPDPDDKTKTVYRDLRYIDAYFKEKFPSILNWLDNYPRVRNKDNKLVKRIQSDVSRLETRIMSRVARDLYNLGYHPVTVHDAIYVTEEDMNKENFKTDLNRLFDKYLYNQKSKQSTLKLN